VVVAIFLGLVVAVELLELLVTEDTTVEKAAMMTVVVGITAL
jgi:hypothetical protein